MRFVRTFAESSTKSKAKWALATTLPIVALGVFLFRQQTPPTNATMNMAAVDAHAQKYVNRSHFRSPTQPSNGAIAQQMISGRVYALDGTVLQGAKVMATTFAIAGNLATTVSAIESDEQGLFALPVPDGTYQILANKAGYGPSYAHAQAGETVSLVLAASGKITGHVHDEQGLPTRQFVLDVLTAGPDHMAAPVPLWSRRFDSADGSFEITELPPWAVVVRASAKDFAPAFSKSVRVEPGQARNIDIGLTAGCSLEGTVKNADGQPLPFVFIDAESRVQTGGTSELSMDTSNRAESDENGHFRLEHTPMGRIAIRGYDNEHAPSTVLVDINDCSNAKPIEIVMTDGGAITGVARGSDGEPLPGARITASQRAIGFVNTIADEAGQFRLESIPAGNTRLELIHGGQRTSTTIRVASGSVTNRDISLYAAGRGEIRGRVTAGNAPLSGVQLIVVANRGRDHGLDMHFPLTDSDGSYHVTGLPGGQYAINVVSSGKTEGIEVSNDGSSVLNLDVAQRQEAPQ